MLVADISNPVIFGCSGLTLTSEERVFFEKSQPLGFILFQRNIESKLQLKTLIDDLKSLLRHPTPFILIDQEGGRVARLKGPTWFHPPAANTYTSKAQVYDAYAKIAEDLGQVGINVNCAPVLDLNVRGADPIMGDRTFSSDPHVIAELGEAAITALQTGGIIPVMKHIPGHGAATCDSHEDLPIVTLSHKQLQPHFEPFKINNKCPWAMTAHIVYGAIDPYLPATQSFLMIEEVIRREIGFQGFLISDDLGMKALRGSFAERARSSIDAGCDAVLHCSGKMEEMEDVLKGLTSSLTSLHNQVA